MLVYYRRLRHRRAALVDPERFIGVECGSFCGCNGILMGDPQPISLPLGAFLGVWLNPKKKVNSVCMAFGAGALLFALTA